ALGYGNQFVIHQVTIAVFKARYCAAIQMDADRCQTTAKIFLTDGWTQGMADLADAGSQQISAAPKVSLFHSSVFSAHKITDFETLCVWDSHETLRVDSFSG